ncbi:hypothetical protein G5I_01511 [Acromyrmex echinatior]|uniref:Uncharacterized protein n=1 Tax=Acromyrmex echinatior TaxID=103372 RepID=F4W7T6_ACREC|nr:hypothetical protein G5I_01511 [Acromyrmex echinatior]
MTRFFRLRDEIGIAENCRGRPGCDITITIASADRPTPTTSNKGAAKVGEGRGCACSPSRSLSTIRHPLRRPVLTPVTKERYSTRAGDDPDDTSSWSINDHNTLLLCRRVCPIDPTIQPRDVAIRVVAAKEEVKRRRRSRRREKKEERSNARGNASWPPENTYHADFIFSPDLPKFYDCQEKRKRKYGGQVSPPPPPLLRLLPRVCVVSIVRKNRHRHAVACIARTSGCSYFRNVNRNLFGPRRAHDG